MSYVKSMQIGSKEYKLFDKRFETEKFYELSLDTISDSGLDTSQNVLLQRIVDGLVSHKTYTIKYGKQILSAIPTKRTDATGSYFALTASKGLSFTIIKVRVDSSNQVQGAQRYEVTPISYGDTVPDTLYPGTVFCVLGGGGGFVTFSADSAFDLSNTAGTWYGEGTVEYSTDQTRWTAWTDHSTSIPAAVQTSGKYEVYLRGKNNTHTSDGTNYVKFAVKNAGTAVPFNVSGNLNDLLDYKTSSTLRIGTCAGMFEDSSVVDASGLVMSSNFDTDEANQYFGLFRDCIQLTTPPTTLPATQLTTNCYQQMFSGCSSLASAPTLPATNLTGANWCYYQMFYNCAALTTAPVLPATTLSEACYCNMFNSSGLTTPPTLSAATLTPQCYSGMFAGCTALASAPTLSVTDLTGCYNCYAYMFQECKALKTAPNLPATQLAESCYQQMFYKCSELLTGPSTLPATTLPKKCYSDMFRECTKLTTGPSTIAATTIGEQSCVQMFYLCENLVNTPTFAPTSMGVKACLGMFNGCHKMYPTPDLSGLTTLGTQCCEAMFTGCYALTEPAVLPATVLSDNCYQEMFNSCTGITWTTDTTATRYSINPDHTVTTEGTSWNLDMFDGCSGTIPEGTGDPLINKNYYFEPKFLTFTSASPFNLQLKENNWNERSRYRKLYYSTDKFTWTQYPNDGTATLPAPVQQASGKYELYLRGVGNTYTNLTYKTQFTSDATDRFDIIGKFDYLLDYTKSIQCGNCQELFSGIGVVDASELVMSSTFSSGTLRYYGMFQNCTALTKAPQLPATTMYNSVYNNMFKGCTELVTPPPTLPATDLTGARSCYFGMFSGCTKLITSPVISATTLAEFCCNSMFYNCKALTSAPVLNATTMVDSCYSSMFYGCEALTTPPALPATTLANNCYSTMFYGCKALASAPTLPATTMDVSSYHTMFSGCTSLTTAPNLPATTLANKCYYQMFFGCSNLVTPPTIAGIDIPESACERMFYDCVKLKTAPTFAPTSMGLTACKNMFQNCDAMTTTPDLSGLMTLGVSCCERMFAGCNSLTAPCELPATVLPEKCYAWMFFLCTGITFASSGTRYSINPSHTVTSQGTGWNEDMLYCSGDIPEGDGTALANKDYYFMQASYLRFKNTSTTANAEVTIKGSNIGASPNIEYSIDKKSTWDTFDPSVGVTLYNKGDTVFFRGNNPTGFSKSTSDYYMFVIEGGTAAVSGDVNSLVNQVGGDINPLPAYCFFRLFKDTTNLTDAYSLNLPSTNVGTHAYHQMFDGSGIVNAPTISATTIGDSGCYGMFMNCASLAAAPALPATTLGDSCCENMFQGCTSLETPPALPATTIGTYCYRWMFAGCPIALWTTASGSAYKIPSSGSSVSFGTDWNYQMFDGATRSPSADTNYYIYPQTTLTFESRSSNAADVVITNNLTVALKYSLDNGATWTALAVGSATTAASKVIVKGRIEQSAAATTNTLGVAGTNVAVSGQLLDGVNYMNLFYGQTNLKYADGLTGASTLVIKCYYQMFRGSGITTTPTLPATTLITNCYNSMFYGCTGLTAPCTLPAKIMAQSCYQSMFQGCTSIIWTTDTTAHRYSLPPTKDGTTAKDFSKSMFSSNGGSPTASPAINTDYYYQ